MSRGHKKRRTVRVNGYSENWLRQGFPWVYPKEVVNGRARSGQWVRVQGKSGQILGSGLADAGWIAVRVFRTDEGPLDEALIHGRLDAAAALRTRLFGPETTGYRLVNGENDGLPGVRIDWWSHYAVITLDSPALAPVLPFVQSWLQAKRQPRGIVLCYRPDPRDDLDLDGVEPAPGLISGRPPPGPVHVQELGLTYLVDPLDGPDVGLYADMREVRRWLQPHWGGRSVLNTFAYTGAFSIAAAMGGAYEIVTNDLSEAYLDRARANFVANDLDPAHYDFVAKDTFKAIDRFRRKKHHFDLVILDPPSFSHSDRGTWSAKRDYPRLVSAAARIVNEGGWILAATNHGATSPKVFRGWVADGLKKAKKRGQELAFLGQSPDFPAATWFPEGNYLKVGVWRVM